MFKARILRVSIFIWKLLPGAKIHFVLAGSEYLFCFSWLKINIRNLRIIQDPDYSPLSNATFLPGAQFSHSHLYFLLEGKVSESCPEADGKRVLLDKCWTHSFKHLTVGCVSYSCKIEPNAYGLRDGFQSCILTNSCWSNCSPVQSKYSWHTESQMFPRQPPNHGW